VLLFFFQWRIIIVVVVIVIVIGIISLFPLVIVDVIGQQKLLSYRPNAVLIHQFLKVQTRYIVIVIASSSG